MKKIVITFEEFLSAALLYYPNGISATKLTTLMGEFFTKYPNCRLEWDRLRFIGKYVVNPGGTYKLRSEFTLESRLDPIDSNQTVNSYLLDVSDYFIYKNNLNDSERDSLIRWLSNNVGTTISELSQKENNFNLANFWELFIAVLKSSNIHSVDSVDVGNFVMRCKKYGLYDDLLKEIDLTWNDAVSYPDSYFHRACDLHYDSGIEYRSDYILLNGMDYKSVLERYPESLINQMQGFVQGATHTNDIRTIGFTRADYHQLYFMYHGSVQQIETLNGKLEALMDEYSSITDKEATYLAFGNEQQMYNYCNSPDNADFLTYRHLTSSIQLAEQNIERILNDEISFSNLSLCHHIFIRDDNELICIQCGRNYTNDVFGNSNGYDEKIKAFLSHCAEHQGLVVKSATKRDYHFVKTLMEELTLETDYEYDGIFQRGTRMRFTTYESMVTACEEILKERNEQRKNRVKGSHLVIGPNRTFKRQINRIEPK